MKCSASRLGPRRFAPLPRATTPTAPIQPGQPRTIPFLVAREDHLPRLGSIAESLGFRFHALETVSELEAYLKEFPTAAVWTDSHVADGSWRDVLEICQRLEPAPAVVVTALSDSPALWAEAGEAGVAEYLVAPFAASEVRRCLLTPSAPPSVEASVPVAH